MRKERGIFAVLATAIILLPLAFSLLRDPGQSTLNQFTICSSAGETGAPPASPPGPCNFCLTGAGCITSPAADASASLALAHIDPRLIGRVYIWPGDSIQLNLASSTSARDPPRYL